MIPQTRGNHSESPSSLRMSAIVKWTKHCVHFARFSSRFCSIFEWPKNWSVQVTMWQCTWCICTISIRRHCPLIPGSEVQPDRTNYHKRENKKIKFSAPRQRFVRSECSKNGWRSSLFCVQCGQIYRKIVNSSRFRMFPSGMRSFVQQCWDGRNCTSHVNVRIHSLLCYSDAKQQSVTPPINRFFHLQISSPIKRSLLTSKGRNST